jgi:hypothetical protein
LRRSSSRIRFITAWRKVGLQCARTAHIKVINPFERLEEGVLDQVVRVGQIAGPAGQASTDKTAQRAEMARHQALQRLLISRARAFDQLERRFEERLAVGHTSAATQREAGADSTRRVWGVSDWYHLQRLNAAEDRCGHVVGRRGLHPVGRCTDFNRVGLWSEPGEPLGGAGSRAAPTPGSPQYRVSGIVTDAAGGGDPIANATVMLRVNQGELTTRTDGNGFYAFSFDTTGPIDRLLEQSPWTRWGCSSLPADTLSGRESRPGTGPLCKQLPWNATEIVRNVRQRPVITLAAGQSMALSIEPDSSLKFDPEWRSLDICVIRRALGGIPGFGAYRWSVDD